MEDNSNELPFLSNVGLMLTYKCTITCPHCIVEAGPKRKEEMCVEQCLAWIEQAREYRKGRIQGLALTGGEPFYNLNNLARISAHGRALGFIISAVTNAFWASTTEQALDILSGLPAIRMLSISTDVYHQKAIPFTFVENAVWAARELGILYNVAVCTDSEEDPEYLRIMKDLERIGETDRVRVSRTFPVGRAGRRTLQLHHRMASEPMNGACSVASSPVIFPDGKVCACIGPVLTLPSKHPLALGNLHQDPLSVILDRAELNTVLHTIRVWGPRKLMWFLEQNGCAELLPKQFIEDCICDVCYRLFSNEDIIEACSRLFENEQNRQTIAYARVHYLHEAEMVERYHLNGGDDPSLPRFPQGQ